MLARKMFREMRHNFGQFLSIFMLAFLAVSLFACMKASNISAYRKLDDLFLETATADGWIYSEGFSKEDLQKIRELSDVKAAQRRMHITANAVEHDQAQLEIFLEDENIVSKPKIMAGDAFELTRTDGIWMSESFAKEWDISVGDEFSFLYNGITVTKKVAGLIVAPEYQYMKADADIDVVLKNMCIIYMPYQGFPAKEYVKSLIRKGDITLENVIEHSDLVREKIEAMEKTGLSGKDITSDTLLDMVDNLEEEKIYDMLPYTEIVFTSDREDIRGMEQEISDVLEGNYAVFCDRDDQPGMKILADELEQHDQFSYLFTVIFLAIALLVIMTTMNRMVAQQRTQIGTMRALGMKRRKIIFHYLSYSFVVSLIGSLAGLFVGTYTMGAWLAALFREWYIVPGWSVEMDASFFVVTVAVIVVCTGATYFSCRKVMNVHPADSLRPAPPKSGKNTIFEKLPFWNKLGFSAQYNLRDISRGKLRAFMGVFGTAAGMMIMVAAFASYSTIQDVTTWTFDKLQNYKTEMDFDSDITVEKAETLQKEYGGELVQLSSIEVAVKKNAVASEKKSTSLVVTEGMDYYRLTDEKQNITSLKPGSIGITMKLAKSLGVSVGDRVYWHLYDKNTWYEAKIGLINRNPSVTGLTMLRKDYENAGAKYVPTALYTNEDIKNYKGTEDDGILAIHDDSDMRESFDIMMSMMNAMIAIFVIFAVLLPVVVLYNCGNLSFHERVKEFATLKVLGFTSQKIRKLLAIQNLWLSVIGVVIGAPCGVTLLQYMFDSNGDSMDYPVSAGAVEYIVPGILVFCISVLVSFMFHKRIRKLDMVEILKGIE